jgi:hypothetical protein
MKAYRRLTNKNNLAALDKSGDDSFIVRGAHYNNLRDDLVAHITSDGVGAFNTIGEYGTGVGVTVDGVLLQDGIVAKVVSVTAITGGTGAAILTGANQFVTVYSAVADNAISLPAASAGLVGTVIRGHIEATGCEIRSYEQATGMYVNDVSGTSEAAIPAYTTFRAELVTAAKWILTAVDNTGGVISITPDAV